jgi:hypothetical protein
MAASRSIDEDSVGEFSTQLEQIWSRTLGDPQVCVAVLDGPVDLAHPCFEGAEVSQLQSWIAGTGCACEWSQHGTHVASVIFGQHGLGVDGVAPRCRGIVIPVFDESEEGELQPCSQLDLARAVAQAVEAGADIINVSGGQLEPSGEAEVPLARAVQMCVDRNVLVVAAAGNDACRCLHVPAALPSVLAVGAMNSRGEPLPFSNWGDRYLETGVLAPGERVLGAAPGGGVCRRGGTSFAAPLVSGVAALLMSIQRQAGKQPSASAVRRAILESAADCCKQSADDCRRLLAGRLNVAGALSRIQKGAETAMAEQYPSQDQPSLQRPKPSQDPASPGGGGQTIPQASGDSDAAWPASSTCGAAAALETEVAGGADAGRGGDLVFALGQLDYDFGTEANRDYYRQQGLASPDNRKDMAGYLSARLVGDEVFTALLGNDPAQPQRQDFPEGEEGDPEYYASFCDWEAAMAPRDRTKAFLRSALLVNRTDASGLIWTLVQDLTPVYAIQPGEAFGLASYDRLVEFFEEQETGRADQAAIAGRVVGRTRLINGQIIPVVRPDIRGMFNWSTDKVVNAAIAAIGGVSGDVESAKAEIKAFAERVYYDFRNLGITAQDRALNYAATNLFQAASVYKEAIKYTAASETKLDRIDVERSPICREGSDCWDVKMTYFNPKRRQEEAKRVFRFTVDVSGVIPVTVGEMRSWYVY